MQMSCFVQKNIITRASFFRRTTTSPVFKSTTFVSIWSWRYHSPNSVFPIWELCRICVIYWGDWLLIKFCENDSFRKLSLFFEKIFQYLYGISQIISVSHFDSRRSLTLANRRRSTSPILFVSFTQPYDQQDRKIRTIRKSAARWRGRRRARGSKKLILRANLLCVPNIKI